MKQGIRKLMALVCVTGALIISGCGSDTAGTQTAKPAEVHLTYVKAPLNIPSIVEKQEGLFEKAFAEDAVKVGYSTITEGPKQTEAMAAGDIDIANALGGTSAILAKANGVDLRIVSMYSRAPKAFVIVAKDPSITSVSDLKGKTVMGPKGTNLHQLLLMALAEQGMQASDVNFVSGGIPQAAAAMENGSANAALLAGPMALKALQSGAHVVRDAQGLLNATIVIAVRGDFLDKHPELVKRFLATHYGVVDAYKKDPTQAYALAAKETGLTEKEVATMAPWYDFNPQVTEEDIKDLEKAQDFLVQAGLLDANKKVDVKSMFVAVQ